MWNNIKGEIKIKRLLSILGVATIGFTGLTNTVSCQNKPLNPGNDTENDTLTYNKITTEISDMWRKYTDDNSYIVLKGQTDLDMLNSLLKLVNAGSQTTLLNYNDNKSVYDFAFEHFDDVITQINTTLTNQYSNYYENGQRMINYSSSKDNIEKMKIRYIKDDTKTKRLGFVVQLKINIKFKKFDNDFLLDFSGGTLSDAAQTPAQKEKNKRAIDIIDNYLANKLAINLPSFDTSNWPYLIKEFWGRYVEPIMKNVNAIDFTKDNNVKQIITSESDLYDRTNISLKVQDSIISQANAKGLELKNNDDINFYNTSAIKLFDPGTGLVTLFDDIGTWTGYHARSFLLNKNNGIFRKTGKIFLDYSYLSVSAFLLDDNTAVVGAPSHVNNFMTFVTTDFWDKINGVNE